MEKTAESSSSPSASSSDRDTLLQIRDIFTLFGHTVAAMRLYPSHHENVTRFSEEFFARLSRYLDQRGELEIGIEENVFTNALAAGMTFGEDSGLKSLPYLFFKDGMRSLTFLPGLTRPEFIDFMEVVKSCAELPPEESDIVDELWERDIEHLRYDAPEEFLETKIATGMVRPNAVQVDRTALFQGQITLDSGDRAAVISRRAELGRAVAADPMDWAELPNELDGGDLLVLEAMLASDRKSSADRELIETMFEILCLEDRDDAFFEILAFLKAYLRTLIGRAALADAIHLVDAMADLRDYLKDNSPERFKVLETATERMIDEADLKTLRDIARPGQIADPHGLFEFLWRFGTFALPLGADIYDAVLNPAWRQAGNGYLRKMMRSHPVETTALAHERKPALTLALIALLGEQGDKKAILQLASFSRWANPAIRLEAVRTLGRLTDDLARKALLEYLHDPDESVRIEAIHLTRLECDPRALNAALKEAAASSFRDRSPAEKEAHLRALGRSNTDEAAAFLRTMLLKKRFLGGNRVREMNLLAVVGLAAMTRPEAEEALKAGAARKNPTIAAACALALRGRGVTREET